MCIGGVANARGSTGLERSPAVGRKNEIWGAAIGCLQKQEEQVN